jgi:hypothetical protein
MSAARRAAFQLSVKQLSKLVLFCAILSAGLTPLVRSGADRTFTMFAVLWVLPPCLAVVARLIMKAGPFRSWLVAFLLCLPIVLTMALVETILLSAMAYTWSAGLIWHPMRAVIAVAACLLLAYGILTFVGPFLPVRCPACASWSLIRPSPSAGARWLRLRETRWCFLCRSSFRRVGRGPWDRQSPEQPSSLRSMCEGGAALGGVSPSTSDVGIDSHA